jgi:hypothetical protein
VLRIVSALAATMLATGLSAGAATLEVGADKPFRQPSEAAAKAGDGDIVAIDPGEYYDCAVWRQNRLTIRATAPGAVITDRTCQGKALFIVDGNDVTISGLTFARARVPDRNGAGIRAEGGSLTLQQDTFINNETGVLAADAPQSELRIVDCAFTRNGVLDEDKAGRALLSGRLGRLVVEGSHFSATRGEEHIFSAAARTELIADDIEDDPTGTRLALVVAAAGGEVLLRDNVLRRGTNPARVNAAMLVMGGDGQAHISGGGNRLANATGRPMALLVDWNDSRVDLAGDVLTAGDAVVSTDGKLRHQLGALAHQWLDEARHLAGATLRRLHLR